MDGGAATAWMAAPLSPRHPPLEDGIDALGARMRALARYGARRWPGPLPRERGSPEGDAPARLLGLARCVIVRRFRVAHEGRFARV